MSADLGKVCSLLLKQMFGKVVQKVGDCLFSSTARTLGTIAKFTDINRSEVKIALAILIKYNMVQFCKSSINPNIAEYSLQPEHVLYTLRYSRYLEHLSKKYGGIGCDIANELLAEGSSCASQIILKCISISDNNERRAEAYRDIFNKMVCDNYLIKQPFSKPTTNTTDESPSKLGKRKAMRIYDEDDMESEPVPNLSINLHELFLPPEVDFIWISQNRYTETASNQQPKDADIMWQLNFIRLHQDFRDTLMINAIERKLGESAGECFKYILQQMYERTDPWQRVTSGSFTFVEIKQAIEKNSNNLDLIRYLEQYITLIAEDSLGFIRKTGDMGAGQYIVALSHAMEELALACIERVITERFSSKATRIFRVIRLKKNIEQEDLQKEAMIPSKEAKLLSYNLFKDQFVHLRTIRKAGGGGSGLARAFYLFHIRTNLVVKMLLDMCYKALFNDLTRANMEHDANGHLIEKSDKVDCIVAAMKERNESEESINEIEETLTLPEREILDKVKKHINMLSRAEIALDDTIFLLEMYFYHVLHAATPKPPAQK